MEGGGLRDRGCMLLDEGKHFSELLLKPLHESRVSLRDVGRNGLFEPSDSRPDGRKHAVGPNRAKGRTEI